MHAAYQHLALSQVEPGMILSDELLDKQGQVLLPRGAVLTAATIALLPAHGIDTLAVLLPGGAAVAKTAPDAEAIELRLARLFRHVDVDDPAWASGTLQRYISDFRLERELAT